MMFSLWPLKEMQLPQQHLPHAAGFTGDVFDLIRFYQNLWYLEGKAHSGIYVSNFTFFFFLGDSLLLSAHLWDLWVDISKLVVFSEFKSIFILIFVWYKMVSNTKSKNAVISHKIALGSQNVGHWKKKSVPIGGSALVEEVRPRWE